MKRMANLFWDILTMSVAGSVIVSLMLILRPVTTKFFSAKWQYGIGKMAVAFFLLPVLLLVRRLPWLQSTLHNYPTKPSIIQKILPSKGLADTIETLTNQHFTLDVMKIVLLVWFLGSLIFAAWHLYCYRRFVKRLRIDSYDVPNASKMTTLLNFYKKELQIHGNVNCMLNPKITSPMLVGLWHPIILLPTFNIRESDLRFILSHELIHLKQKDLWIKMFMLIVETLYWFNPFIHVLRKDINTWSELACDEALALKMPFAERRRYGETILNALENHSGTNTVFCSSLCQNKKHIERRLMMLLNIKKMKKHISIFAVVTVILIAAIGTGVTVFAANSNSDNNPSNNLESCMYYISDDVSDAEKFDGSTTPGTTHIPQLDTSDMIEGDQVVSFATQEELDTHFAALEERKAEGLNPYEGFEELYTNVDFALPIVYTIGK